jgi:peptidoglycan/LPS O-acetylase OafA/YrhL
MAALKFNWTLNPVVSGFCFYSIFFAIGVALYDHYEKILEKGKILFSKNAPWLAFGIFLAMIGVSLVVKNYENITAFMAAAMSVILIVHLLSRNLQIKWLIGIGRFSYTLYITHFASILLYLTLYFLITKDTPPNIYNALVFIPCVFFCVGIAYVQYYFVERKSKHVLDGLRKKEISRKEENRYTEVASANKAEKTNW